MCLNRLKFSLLYKLKKSFLESFGSWYLTTENFKVGQLIPTRFTVFHALIFNNRSISSISSKTEHSLGKKKVFIKSKSNF